MRTSEEAALGARPIDMESNPSLLRSFFAGEAPSSMRLVELESYDVPRTGRQPPVSLLLLMLLLLLLLLLMML